MKLGTLRLSGMHCTSRAVIELILLLATAVPIVAHGDGPTTSPPVNVVGKPDCGYYGNYAVYSQGSFVDCESAGQLFGPGNSGTSGAVGAPYGGDGGGAGSPATDNQNRNPKNNDCHTPDGDPVIVTTGNKVETFTDFSGTGEMPLTLTRTYSSNSNGGILFTPTGLGKHVVSSFDYGLQLGTNWATSHNYYQRRPDGSSIHFVATSNPSVFIPDKPSTAQLVVNSDGTSTLYDDNGTTQTYNINNLVTSVLDKAGVGWTYTYNPNVYGQITRITHTSGVYLQINWTTISEPADKTVYVVQSIFNSAGNTTYTYNWDTVATSGPLGGAAYEARLRSVTLPWNPTVTIAYQYTDSVDPTLLTEVDYNGTPYSKTSYYDSGTYAGHPLATWLADGSERTSFIYAANAQGGVTTSATNALGQVTDYAGDANDDLISVTGHAAAHCAATFSSATFTSTGLLQTATDNNGNTHTYNYAANGQLQSETEASGTGIARTTNYGWDPNALLNRLLSVTVVGESEISYTYNGQNRLASVTRTNLKAVGTPNQALTTSYTYTLYGNGMVESMAITAPSPGGSDKTTSNYDTYGNVTSIVDGLGHTATYSFYNAQGEPGKVVGPNGDETDYSYDAGGHLLGKTTHPNGGTASWVYRYDGFGLIDIASLPDGEYIAWTRDAEMRVKTVTRNDKDGTSTETFVYDANGDVTSDVVARGGDVGKSTSYVYDALGRVYQVKGSHSQSLTYAYDGNGNVLSVTDALGHKTSYAYDALNRLASTTDAANSVTSYTYDVGNHITHVTDPRGLVTGYAWDGLGQLWQRVSPDTGTTNYGYDAYGRLSSFIRADATQTYLGYDALNRLTSKAAGGVTRQYTWDSCTNGKGRLCAASNQGYDSVGYSYSPEGWITGRSFSISGGPTYGLGYAYDNMGHLAVVDYPDGNEALYDYTDGAVADVRMKVGTYNITGISGITYRPMDLAMSNWTSYNGLTNTISYDSDLRPTSISVPNTESLAFTYDAADRITYITNGMNNSDSQSLGYDALNRLTSVNSTADNESYGYDADGNRTSMVVNGSSVAFSMAPDSNRLITVGGTTFGYDANGNTLTANGNTLYQYGPFNRLTNANGMTYRTSAEDQRIFKSGTPRTTYFAPDAGGTLMAEYDPNGVWLDYIWLNGKLVTVVTSNGGVYPVHDDQTGRPIAMTNLGNQSVIWAAQNLPFTRNVTTSTWFSFNLGFPGQYQDAEDGIWHNGDRDYNAYLGRYIESDPIGLTGGVNTYAYVGNNPISTVDSTGLIGYVCQKGNNVGINIPIDFQGATPAEISAMTQAIQSAWSGQFGQYNVVTTVTSVSSFNSAVNIVNVIQGHGQSYVQGTNTGYWYSNGYYINGIDYAHEAGHLLGLPDESPVSNSVMGAPWEYGRPNENDINGVLNASSNKCGC